MRGRVELSTKPIDIPEGRSACGRAARAMRETIRVFLISLQRYVAVLSSGSLNRLAQADLKAADQLASRLAGFDDVVDVASFGGDVRVGKTCGVFGHQFLATACGILRHRQVSLVDDVHGRLGSHDRDLGGWPRQI